MERTKGTLIGNDPRRTSQSRAGIVKAHVRTTLIASQLCDANIVITTFCYGKWCPCVVHVCTMYVRTYHTDLACYVFNIERKITGTLT